MGNDIRNKAASAKVPGTAKKDAADVDADQMYPPPHTSHTDLPRRPRAPDHLAPLPDPYQRLLRRRHVGRVRYRRDDPVQ